MTIDHASFMSRALYLAEKGKGRVEPNPYVGCVIVKKGKIVGEGYHQHYGGAHAEMEALKAAGKQAQGASLYINLEPCSHWGKTPPCAPLVAASGIKEIFISMKDPNPLVNGKGLQTLRRKGIRVHLGLLEDEAKYLNRAFVTWKTKNRPHVVLKMAMSLDGKIATAQGHSKWITGPTARRIVHRLRAESGAVLVGRGTVERDNPELTSHGQGKNPIRVILDPKLKMDPRLKILSDQKAPTWIISRPQIPSTKAKMLEKRGNKIFRQSLKFGQFKPIDILSILYKNNVNQVFIEGGGNTAWPFVSQNFVDEIYLFVAPRLIGGKNAPTPIEGRGFLSISQSKWLKDAKVIRIGSDFLFHGLI